MKPMIIIPNGVMTKENLDILRSNDICIVECKDPSKVKFVDPIPASTSRTEMEIAAIRLSRMLLTWQFANGSPLNPDYAIRKDHVAKFYVDLLIEGTPLSSAGTKEEQQQKLFDETKNEEIRKIAREEACAESKAKREAQKKLTEMSKPK